MFGNTSLANGGDETVSSAGHSVALEQPQVVAGLLIKHFSHEP